MPAILDVTAARRAGFAIAAAGALLAAASPGPAGAAEWAVPVHGWVARGFDLGSNPFEAGRHRGADFAARPGTVVRAACGGRVLVAGRVGSSGRVVTIGCGPWRVTHLPLADVAVRAGAVVDPGARIGSAAASRRHGGLHLGVRRDGDRFGYVDPLRFVSRDRLPPPPLGAIPPRGRRLPSPPVARAAAAGGRETAERRVGPAQPDEVDARPVESARRSLAPWPAWAGLALLLAGAVGAGVGKRPRKRRAPLPRATAQEVR